jgi:hypothetical protein
MGLPSDFPPRSGPARNAYILGAIDDGSVAPAWRPLTVTFAGHTATFFVLGDALKLGGTRLSTSTYNLQQIADKLNASLMTPRLIDWAFLHADIVIPPQTIYPPDDSIQALETESSKMDSAILAATGGFGASGGLIAPLGKNWCLSNALLSAKAGHAALYGWAMMKGYKAPVGVTPRPGTLPGILNIQPLATPHDINYTDYAMLTSLVRRDCVLDGRPADVWSLVQSPDLSVASLVSHEGPLKLIRQPGVPVVPPLVIQTGPVAVTSGAEAPPGYDAWWRAIGQRAGMPYAPYPLRPWGYAANGKPLPLGTQVQIRQHEQHLAKKKIREVEHPVWWGAHSMFWNLISIPLTTIAGITIGKLIEKRRLKT